MTIQKGDLVQWTTAKGSTKNLELTLRSGTVEEIDQHGTARIHITDSRKRIHLPVQILSKPEQSNLITKLIEVAREQE
jgi:hypothetical protein